MSGAERTTFYKTVEATSEGLSVWRSVPTRTPKRATSTAPTTSAWLA